MSSTTTPSPHKGGAFDMDEYAILRAALVIGGILLILAIYCCVRCYKNSQSSRSRIRKYDIVSSRELQTGLTENSDSDDDLFSTPTSDRQKLVGSSG